MVFTSYGGLIPGQSEQDFFSCSSMPRNRELMRVFKDIGLVEQLGSGMSRILKMYDKSIFKISEHFIKVEFPFSMPKDISFSDNNEKCNSGNIDNTQDNIQKKIVNNYFQITRCLLQIVWKVRVLRFYSFCYLIVT